MQRKPEISEEPPKFFAPTKVGVSDMQEKHIFVPFMDMKSRVTIHISGEIFETYEHTLAYFPDTLLGSPVKRQEYFDYTKNAYCFNTNKFAFDAILFYYQSKGILSRPSNVEQEAFEQELKFYEIQVVKAEDMYKIKPSGGRKLPEKAWKKCIWENLEYPDTSRCAQCFGKISMLIIIVSIVSFCAETMVIFRQEPSQETTQVEGQPRQQRHQFWFILDSCVIGFFTAEYFLRLISSPNIIHFIFSPFAIIDGLAILPYFLTLALDRYNTKVNSLAVMRVLRLLRVSRLLKLTRHIGALKILVHTVKLCAMELISLLSLVSLVVIFLSSLIFYSEYEVNGEMFPSVLHAFWWSIITMTTVGYGDVYPVTVIGKVIGAGCASIGIVLLFCLPSPVFIMHFNNVYTMNKHLCEASTPQVLMRGKKLAEKLFVTKHVPKIESTGPAEIL